MSGEAKGPKGLNDHTTYQISGDFDINVSIGLLMFLEKERQNCCARLNSTLHRATTRSSIC